MSGEPSWRVTLGQHLVLRCQVTLFGSFLVDGYEVLRQGCMLLGAPALRPLSELLDIVVQLLIGCC